MKKEFSSINQSLSDKAHVDGWANILSGLGQKGRDKTTTTTVAMSPHLTHNELTELYKGDGIGSRIVNAKADDMVQGGWRIPADSEGTLSKAEQRLNVKRHLMLGLKWARLYGGSIIYMDIPSSGLANTAFDPSKALHPGVIRSLKVYPAPRMDIMFDDFVRDPQSPWFEDVERFHVQNQWGGYFDVHRSRCLVFRGLDCPNVLDDGRSMEERFWGQSCLMPIFGDLSSLGAMVQGLGHLGQEFSISKLKISNLENLVAEGDFTSINKRMEIIAVCKSLINAVLLGENEEYSRDTMSFTGVGEILDRFMMMVAGGSNYPVTRLFGRSAAGMNATGEGDMLQYYDGVASDQETVLQPELLRLLAYLNYGLGSPIPPDELTVQFNPLIRMSEKEKADIRKVVAETDQIYVSGIRVFSPGEVRKRFEGEWTADITVEPDSPPPEDELDQDTQDLLKGVVPQANPKPVAPTKATSVTPAPGSSKSTENEPVQVPSKVAPKK